MTVATTSDSEAKSNQATFLKVGQNLYRNESSSTYYGLTKRGGKQFRTALRMEDGTPIKDRGLAERALRKWLSELEKCPAGGDRAARELRNHYQMPAPALAAQGVFRDGIIMGS
jgi:hypothetical protein